MRLRKEITRLERSVAGLGSLDRYASLQGPELDRRLADIEILQIEARGFLQTLKDGRFYYKLAVNGADGLTGASVIVWGGAQLSAPLLVTLDAAMSGGTMTLLGAAVMVGLRARTFYLRTHVDDLERLQQTITEHLGAARAAHLRR